VVTAVAIAAQTMDQAVVPVLPVAIMGQVVVLALPVVIMDQAAVLAHHVAMWVPAAAAVLLVAAEVAHGLQVEVVKVLLQVAHAATNNHPEVTQVTLV
jgi:uncharacterized protein (DUF983 family)